MASRNKLSVVNRYGTDESIALASRISYGAKHVESDRVEPIIKGLIANKEGTPFEFASLWFYIRCSRICHSQFLQYRHASRITRSLRRTEPIEFWDREGTKLPAGYEQTHTDYALRDYEFQTKELGVSREQARRILPMSILTEFYWLVNLRELMHFLDERLSNKAEQEIRDIAKLIELDFAGAFPITYRAWRGGDGA